MRVGVVALLAAVATAILTTAAEASPLDLGSWYHIARMADDDPDMFDGNGNLAHDYTFGTYSGLMQEDDFHRPFTVYDTMQILFITGDETIWGMTSYSTLRSLIDAQSGTFATNITFDTHIGTTDGNVLSRSAFQEDPWISLVGDHFTGVLSNMIIWGENGYGAHITLKNTHGGVNVFVSTPAVVPVPAALPLMLTGLAMMGALGWRRRRALARS